MKFDKRISRLLAKSLLVPLGVSCFNFCCVSAMENKTTIVLSKEEQELIETLKMMDKVEKQKEKKITGKKRLSPEERQKKQEERQRKKAQKQKDDEITKVNQCIKKAISSQGCSVQDMMIKFYETDFKDRSYFFATNLMLINKEKLYNIIRNLSSLNQRNPLTKENPASLLLDTVEDLKKTITKSSELPPEKAGEKLTPEQSKLLDAMISYGQFNLFNKNFADMIALFLGKYKSKSQNVGADSLLKTLNIQPSGKWAEENPEKANARAKKCIYDVICMLQSQESIINLEEEKK